MTDLERLQTLVREAEKLRKLFEDLLKILSERLK